MSYKILVINLEKRTDRKQQVINIFNNIKFEDYIFYNAVDGKNIKLTLEIKNLFKNNDFGNRKGFIGCALSHYYIWIDLVKDITNDYYIIFEDDFQLSDNFVNCFDISKEHMNNNLNTCDILFLGYHTCNKEIYNGEITINNFENNNYIGGTFGYIITKQGAYKMLEYIEENGIKHGIDYVMKINLKLNKYIIMPHIVLSDWVRKVNDGVDTDIQNDFETFNFNTIFDTNNFIFKQGVDQMNNDYKFLNNKNIDYLLNYSKDIAGFNTLGFTKSFIDINSLIKSEWFNVDDGIFINLDRKINVKMICDWCDSKKICDDWEHMSHKNNVWNNIKITHEDKNIDYYIIINKSFEHTYIPEKTIIFQMEPWCYNEDKTWGVKTWGEWAVPDEDKFMHVRTHKKYYNNCTWNIKLPDKIIKKYDYLSTICSSKYFDEGHIKRIDFLKFIELKDSIKIDIYGIDNKHNFNNYKGKLSDDLKHEGIIPYKYYFMVENNIENNYITEKLWEPIVSECLCFYWGAPNISNYIDSMAYIQLDMNDFEKSYNIIKESITCDLWTQRIDIIRKEKYKVLNYYNFFPTIERIITQDLWKNNTNIFNIKVLIFQKNDELNYKIIPFINTLKDFGIDIDIKKYINNNEFIVENIKDSDCKKRILYKNTIKYYESKQNINISKILTQITTYEELYENNLDYLILNDDFQLEGSLNNLFNHILYLPENYDICQLYNSNKPFKIINQYNPLYYIVRKYFFETNEGYFISNNGMKKVLKYFNNNITCDSKDLIYKCYENNDNFNFYYSKMCTFIEK